MENGFFQEPDSRFQVPADLDPPAYGIDTDTEEGPRTLTPAFHNAFHKLHNGEPDEVPMTRTQAIQALTHLGMSEDEIIQLSNGIGHELPVSYAPDGFPTHIEDAVSQIKENIMHLNLDQPFPDTNFTHLQPLIQPIAYEDLDSDVQRYTPRLRPKIMMPTIPPFKTIRLNPFTLKPDEKGPGLKPRDPSVVLIYLVGCPGSGKSTIAKVICEKYHFKYIGVGELLERERQSPESPYRTVLDNMLSKGVLGPYKMVPSIIISEISKEMEKGFKQVFLIDGFPRYQDSAIYFEQKMQPCDKILSFECSLETSVKRYNDTMGSSDEQILQEARKKVEDRYMLHEQEKGPVRYYYRRQGKLACIDAEIPMEKVQAQVEIILKDNLVSGFVGNRQETREEVNKKTWESMRETMERQCEREGYVHSDSESAEQEEHPGRKRKSVNGNAPGPTFLDRARRRLSPFTTADMAKSTPESAMTPDGMLTKHAGRTPIARGLSKVKHVLRKRASASEISTSGQEEDEDIGTESD